jgi:hypothetical protein
MIPNLEGWEKAQPKLHQVMCSYCRQFVLDQKKFDDLAGWLSFLKRQSPIVYPADEQYENLLTRIIGSLLVSNSDPFFSRLSLNEKLSKSRKLNEEAVVGCRTAGIGMTGEKPTRDDVHVIHDLLAGSLTNVIQSNHHLGSLKTVVIWNKSQLNVLLARPNKVVLDSDFGCGKTLLMKSMATHLAVWLNQYNSSPKVDVIFASVSAARSQV